MFSLISEEKPTAHIAVPPFTRTALRIWHLVLLRNRGLSFSYIMNKYPAVSLPIFVDASTSWGFGGVHGYEYFSFSHSELRPLIRRSRGWEAYPRVPVARLELIAALVAVQLFAHRYPRHLIILLLRQFKRGGLARYKEVSQSHHLYLSCRHRANQVPLLYKVIRTFYPIVPEPYG